MGKGKLVKAGSPLAALAAYAGTGGGGDADTLNGNAGTFYLDRVNHTGSQLAATISDFAAAVALLTIDADTLGGSNLAAVLDRANHTGTQLAATISDFSSAVNALSLDADNFGGQLPAYYLARTNHTGTQLAATISDLSTAVALLTSLDSSKLGNQLPAYYLDRVNHTGTQLANTISDFNTAVGLLSIDADNLNGQNAAYYLARANHTGTQLAATISDFSTTVNGIESSGIVGTPGNLKYYGTDGVGTKGFFDLPAIGTGPANFQDVIRLTGKITPPQLIVNTNDFSPTGLSTANVIFISCSGNRDLTGIAAQEDGRLILLVNYDAAGGDFKLKNNNTNSIAANRFFIDGDVSVVPGHSARLIYSTTISRWILAQNV